MDPLPPHEVKTWLKELLSISNLYRYTEELAKEALTRRKSYQENADSMNVNLEAQKEAVEKLIANTRFLAGLDTTCHNVILRSKNQPVYNQSDSWE